MTDVTTDDFKDDPDKDRIEFLWKVIGRYDTYLVSTNSKAALVATFATFVLGGTVLKWNDIEALFTGHPKLLAFAAAFIAIAAIASAVSLIWTFRAIHPFTWSHKRPGQYHSDIFYAHVAEYGSGDDYRESITKADNPRRIEDACNQAHALAKGLTNKMSKLQVAVVAIIVAIVAVVATFACLLLTSLPN